MKNMRTRKEIDIYIVEEQILNKKGELDQSTHEYFDNEKDAREHFNTLIKYDEIEIKVNTLYSFKTILHNFVYNTYKKYENDFTFEDVIEDDDERYFIAERMTLNDNIIEEREVNQLF